MVIVAGLFLLYSAVDAHSRIDKLEKIVAECRRENPSDDPERLRLLAAAEARKARLAAEKRATEKNERNREIKRRAKERKAAAIAERKKEQNQVLLRAVAESLEYEQVLRNQKASGYGWPVHPNDMDWLDEAERQVMMQVFSERGPFRQEWLNPDV